MSHGNDRSRADRPTIGWREWVCLPDLGGAVIKAKVDTGARTSALHAFDIEQIERDGVGWMRFEIHPEQRSTRGAIVAEAPLVEHRGIRSSTGAEELRPIVATTLELDGERFGIELALARRDQMGFRMLIGREAVRRRFVVDPGRSYRGAESKRVRRALREQRVRRPIEAEVAER